MPNNIDKNVVQMTFDNQQFERGVEQSRNSLSKLKESLSFDKALSSFQNVEKAFQGFDLTSVSDAVQGLEDRFSAWGVASMAVITKVTNWAVEKGIEIAKALSIDNIGLGEQKYETKSKAVRTIMAATGKSLEEVDTVLQTLMKYTDETSYDFATMVETIGKFTSAGVDLERSEKAMEGIANAAAQSGAGVQEANRAMYNFAQSLAMGTVKLQDWKSIENANMATKQFKEELIKTAIAEGTLNKKGEATGSVMKQTKKATKQAAAEFKETEVNYKTFSSTLSEGWLTSDVLIKTLERYADTTNALGKEAFEAAKMYLTWGDVMDTIKDSVSSGWMQSFEYIFGNMEEARELWTKVGDSILEFTGIFTEARNEMLKYWHEHEGYTKAIEAASNIWHAFMDIVNGIREALHDFFPENMGEELVKVTDKIKEKSEEFRNMFRLGGTEEYTKDIEHRIDLADKLNETMKKGDKEGKNGRVTELQKGLIKAGVLDKTQADGIFGPATEAAVKKLQQKLGVEATGVWDSTTRKAAAANHVFGQTVELHEHIFENVYETSTAMQRLQDVVRGLASVFDIAKDAIFTVFTIWKNFVGMFMPLVEPVTRFISHVGVLLTELRKRLKNHRTFFKIIGKVKSILQPVAKIIQVVADKFNALVDVISKARSFPELFKIIQQELEKSSVGQFILKNIRMINGAFKKVWGVIVKVKNFIKSILTEIGKQLENNSGTVGHVIQVVMNIASAAFSIFTMIVTGVSKGIQIIHGVIMKLFQFLQPLITPVLQFLMIISAIIGNTAFEISRAIKKIKVEEVVKHLGPLRTIIEAIGNAITKVNNFLLKYSIVKKVNEDGKVVEKRVLSVSKLIKNFKAELSKTNAGRVFLQSITTIKKSFERLKKVVKDIGDTIAGVFNGADTEEGQKTQKQFGETFTTVLITISKGISTAINVITKGIEIVWGVIKTVASYLQPVINPILKLIRIVSKMFTNLFVSISNNTKNIKVDSITKKLEPLKKIFETIGNAINNFVKRFKKFAYIGTVVDENGKKIKKYKFTFETFFKFIEQELRKTKIGSFIFGIVDKVKPAVTKLLEFFGKIKEGIGKFIADINNPPESGRTGLLGFIDKIKEAFGGVGDWFKNLFGGKKDGKKAGEGIDIFKVIGEKIKKVVDFLKGVNVAQLAMFGIALYGAFKVFNKIRGIVKTPMDILNNIKDTTENVAGVVGDFKKNQKLQAIGDFVKSIGIAVALLAASIFALAQLDYGKAWSSVGIIVVLMGAMIGVAALMKKFDLGGINTKGFLMFSVTVLILANAVIKLAALPFEKMMSGLLGLTAIFGELIAFSKLTEGASFNTSGMIGLGVAILLLVKSLRSLAKMKWDKLIRGLVGLGAVMLELGVFLKLTSGSQLQTGLLSMVGVGVAIWLLTRSLKSIADMEWGEILKGLIGLGAVMLELGVFIRLTSGYGSSKSLLGMVGIGIAVWLIAKSMAGLAEMSWGGILKGIIALGAIFLELAAFMKLIGSNNPGKMLGNALSLLAIGAALGLVTISFRALARLKGRAILKGVIALGAIFLEIAAFMKLISKRNPAAMLGNALSMVGIGAALGLITLSLMGLATIKVGNLVKGIAAIGVLLVELGVFMNKLGSGGSGLKAIPSLIVIAGALAAFTAALLLLGNVNWTTILSFGASLALVLNSITNCMNTLGKMPIKSSLMALANLDLFIANLVLILGAFAGLEKLTGGAFGEWMQKGAEIIGRVIGGFINGIISGINGDKPKKESKTLADYIKEFIASIRSMIPGMNSMAEEAKQINVKGLKRLAKAMEYFVIIAGAMLGTKLIGLLGGLFDYLAYKEPLQAFVDDLDTLVPYVQKLAETKEINADRLKNVASAMEQVATIALAVLATEFVGLLSSLFSFNDSYDNLQTFIDNLDKLVPYVIQLAKTKEINADRLKNVAEAMSQVVKIGGSVLAAEFIGLLSGLMKFNGQYDNLQTFISNLKTIMPTVKGLSKVENVNATKIQNVAEAMSKVADVATGLLKVQFLNVITKLVTFNQQTENLQTFVDSLKLIMPYVRGLSKVDQVNVGRLQNVSEAMGKVADIGIGVLKVQFMNVITKLFTFNQQTENLRTFIDSLKTIMPYVRELANSDEMNVERLKNVAKAMSAVKDIAVGILKTSFINIITKLVTFNDEINNLADFVVGVELLMPLLAELSNTDELNIDRLKNISEAMGVLSDMATASMKVSWKEWASNITSFIGGEGSQTIVNFAERMCQVAPKLVDLGEAAKDINIDGVNTASTALEALAEAAKKIPESNGVIQAIVGEHDIGSFGTDLEAVGSGLKKFADSTKGIPTDYDTTGPVKAVEALAGLESSLEAHGGVAQWLTGDKDLGKFGESIGTLGTNLSSFFQATADINTEQIKSLGEGLQALGEAVAYAPDTTQIANGLYNLQVILDGLPELDYSGVIEIGEEIVKNIADGIEKQNNKESDNPGSEIADMMDATKGLPHLIKAYYSDFKTAGEYLDEGIEAGLESYKSKVTTKAAEVARQAYEAACKELQMNSPSKKGKYIGKMFDAGISDGLDENSGSIESMASEAANKALSGANDISDTDSVGKTVMQSIADSITNNTQIVKDAISNTVDDVNNSDNWKIEPIFQDKNAETFYDTLRKYKQDVYSGKANEDIKAAYKTLSEYETKVLQAPIPEGEAGKKAQTLVKSQLEDLNHHLEITDKAVEDGRMTQEEAAKSIELFVNKQIKDTQVMLKSHSEDFTKTNNEIASNGYTESKQIGENMDAGIIEGLESKESSVSNKAREVAGNAYQAALNELQIHSPSKKGNFIGQMFDEGVAGGLTAYSDKIGDSASKATSGALDSATKAINGIKEVASTDIDTTPTIRPVLDTTDMDAGMEQFSKEASDKVHTSVGISTEESTNQAKQISDKIFELRKDFFDFRMDLKELTMQAGSAVASLDAKLEGINNSINSLGIYLDSSAIVAGTVAKMDQALGQRHFRATGRR